MDILKKLNERFEEAILVFLLANITIWVFVQVIMRYVFHNSLTWSEEFVRWCFIWFIWVGVSYGFRVRKHISITVFVDKLSGKYKKIAELLVNFIVLWCMLNLFYFGYEQISNPIISRQSSIVLKWPLFGSNVSMLWLYASLPFGAFFSSFRLIQNITVDIATLRK
ncbi:MAG: TRAP transporter small permease [Succinatimonas sp.]|nr:TRAP transporter small permease [Succinatimonas sp.]